MLQRDRERYKEVRSRVNISPLGAAALAGTKIKIDRHFTAAELGFKKIYKKLYIYQNLYYKFFNLIIIAPSPPSFFSAPFIEIINLLNSEVLMNSGTEYFNFPKFFDI